MSYDVETGKWKCDCGAVDHYSCLCPSGPPSVQTTKDVHTEHCCSHHGCKYDQDKICTVVTGRAPQSHPCEVCHWEIDEGDVWELAHMINDAIDWERKRLLSILDEAISSMESGGCQFWACDGPEKPIVPMKTCRVCAGIQELRKLREIVG